MRIKQIIIYCISIMLLSLISFIPIGNILADKLFKSSYPCHISSKICQEKGGIRKIDGFEVKRDCWKWKYIKKCDYPSKNNCQYYTHCYNLGVKKCLLRDSLNNCVNELKEFSCKSFIQKTKKTQTAKRGLKAKPGVDKIVCDNALPCFDGNCVNKSYKNNTTFMEKIAKLLIIFLMQDSKIKSGDVNKDPKVNLFAGKNEFCEKKPFGYTNCCKINKKTWGNDLNAKCKPSEKELAEHRADKKCHYIGKYSKAKLGGIGKLNTHQFCCFKSILDKTIQIGARDQLDELNWGTPKHPNCSGVTIEQLGRVDFNKIDYSEFIDEISSKYTKANKVPSKEGFQDIASSVEANINQYDENATDAENNLTGWNTNINDGSDEGKEERRNAEEKSENQNIAEEIAAEKQKEKECLYRIRYLKDRRIAEEYQRQRSFKTRIGLLNNIELHTKTSDALRQKIARNLEKLHNKLESPEYQQLFSSWDSNYRLGQAFKRNINILDQSNKIYNKNIENISYAILKMPEIEEARKQYQIKLDKYLEISDEYYSYGPVQTRSRDELYHKMNSLGDKYGVLEEQYSKLRESLYENCNKNFSSISNNFTLDFSLKDFTPQYQEDDRAPTAEESKLLNSVYKEFTEIENLAKEVREADQEQYVKPWRKIINDHQSW